MDIKLSDRYHYENTWRYTGIIIFFVFFLNGCSLIPTRPGATPQTPPQLDVLPETIENDSRDKTYLELKERLVNLEQKIVQMESTHQKTMEDLLQTIDLLELNLVEIKKKQAALLKKPSPKKLPQSSVESKIASPTIPSGKPIQAPTSVNKSLISEIETPDTSKAIETIALIPSIERKDQPDLKKTADTETLPADLPKLEKIDKLDSFKAESFPTRGWEDPDLDPPYTPIKLSVIPGAKKQYQNAFKVYSKRKYSDAIESFRNYVARFPNDQDTDNALYWIGLSQFRLGNYLEAERSFRNVLKNYQHGDTKHGFKSPDSILMLGRIYLIKEKPIKARYYFQQVITRYPTSISASKAQKEIQSMNVF